MRASGKASLPPLALSDRRTTLVPPAHEGRPVARLHRSTDLVQVEIGRQYGLARHQASAFTLRRDDLMLLSRDSFILSEDVRPRVQSTEAPEWPALADTGRAAPV
jgi:hypothetical protein